MTRRFASLGKQRLSRFAQQSTFRGRKQRGGQDNLIMIIRVLTSIASSTRRASSGDTIAVVQHAQPNEDTLAKRVGPRIDDAGDFGARPDEGGNLRRAIATGFGIHRRHECHPHPATYYRVIGAFALALVIALTVNWLKDGFPTRSVPSPHATPVPQSPKT
jgi:hypothetical protein